MNTDPIRDAWFSTTSEVVPDVTPVSDSTPEPEVTPEPVDLSNVRFHITQSKSHIEAIETLLG